MLHMHFFYRIVELKLVAGLFSSGNGFLTNPVALTKFRTEKTVDKFSHPLSPRGTLFFCMCLQVNANRRDLSARPVRFKPHSDRVCLTLSPF